MLLAFELLQFGPKIGEGILPVCWNLTSWANLLQWCCPSLRAHSLETVTVLPRYLPMVILLLQDVSEGCLKLCFWGRLRCTISKQNLCGYNLRVPPDISRTGRCGLAIWKQCYSSWSRHSQFLGNWALESSLLSIHHWFLLIAFVLQWNEDHKVDS